MDLFDLCRLAGSQHFRNTGAGFLKGESNIVTQRNPGKRVVLDFKRLLANTVQLLEAEDAEPYDQNHHQCKADGGPHGNFQLSQHVPFPSAG